MSPKQRELRILMAGQSLSEESGLIGDLMRGEAAAANILKSLVSPLTWQLAAVSGVENPTLSELESICRKTRHQAAHN